MKAGIIGVGNPLRRDDGIGIVLLEKLIEKKSDLPEGIEYIDGGTGGMNLLHIFQGSPPILPNQLPSSASNVKEVMDKRRTELISPNSS